MRTGISVWRSSIPLLGASLMIAALFFVTAPNAAAAQSSKKAAANYPVDVNSADVSTLETLPGVTPKLAQAIVDGRPYQSTSDLGKVKGMSKTKLNGIKNDITFGPTTASKSAKKKKSTAPAGEETSTAAKHHGTSTAASPTGAATGKLAPGQTVNINTASAEELQALPGIGPTKAQAIVDYRNQNGKFATAEDIEKVKGIKEGEFSKIKDYITVK